MNAIRNCKIANEGREIKQKKVNLKREKKISEKRGSAKRQLVVLRTTRKYILDERERLNGVQSSS